MELKLQRRIYTHKSTIGDLYLDGAMQCHILEDVVRPPGVKVQNQTAIPAGRYRVVIDYSNHFHRYMAHILDVPNFVGIRIHSGNVAADTDGCLLTGALDRQSDRIVQSHAAYAELWQKLAEDDGYDELHQISRAKIREECWIEIVDDATALEAILAGSPA